MFLYTIISNISSFVNKIISTLFLYLIHLLTLNSFNINLNRNFIFYKGDKYYERILFRWRINHTVVERKRLKFNGTAIGLFGLWIKWLLLSIITLGIYTFWVRISLEKWKVKNTSFLN